MTALNGKQNRRDFLRASAALGLSSALGGCQMSTDGDADNKQAELIITNGRISTQDARRPSASAVAIKGGRFVAVGDDEEVLALRGRQDAVIDLRGRTVIPGLNDSHLHLIRGGLNYNLELRWDGVPVAGRRPADAPRAGRAHARRRSGCASSAAGREFQFAERRMPTLDEINAAAPDTPVFVLHLYDRALLNRAALRAVGYTKDTPDPPGGEDPAGQAGQPDRPAHRPAQRQRSSTPRWPRGRSCRRRIRSNSTRHFMRELNRLGVTSAIDAGGGFQNYPDDYKVINESAPAGRADRPHRLQPVHAAAEAGARRLQRWVEDDQARRGRRLLPHERRGRDARLLGGRLRGLPRTPSRPAARRWRTS